VSSALLNVFSLISSVFKRPSLTSVWICCMARRISFCDV
jgi:hypothetical protein